MKLDGAVEKRNQIDEAGLKLNTMGALCLKNWCSGFVLQNNRVDQCKCPGELSTCWYRRAVFLVLWAVAHFPSLEHYPQPKLNQNRPKDTKSGSANDTDVHMVFALAAKR